MLPLQFGESEIRLLACEAPEYSCRFPCPSTFLLFLDFVCLCVSGLIGCLMSFRSRRMQPNQDLQQFFGEMLGQAGGMCHMQWPLKILLGVCTLYVASLNECGPSMDRAEDGSRPVCQREGGGTTVS